MKSAKRFGSIGAIAMGEHKPEVTKTLISSFEVKDRIGSIFPDSAILDLDFKILSISQNLLDATGYQRNEVQDKSISLFSTKDDCRELLATHLESGYFEEQTFDFRCKNGQAITCSVSGFYIGLVTDVNGLIVLRFVGKRNYAPDNDLKLAVANELDDFIYTSAHSLRGPLATIKGLIHLAKKTKDATEKAFLVDQMDIFAEKLDEKLHQLIYVAESDKAPCSIGEDLFIGTIFERLKMTLHDASVGFPTNFLCAVVDQEQPLEKGEQILSMLNNFMLFFGQQPKVQDNQLVFDVLCNSTAIEIMIQSKGILLSNALVEKINKLNFSYSDILNVPELLNYYAAKKIMLQMNGIVQFIHTDSDEVVILMNIPRDGGSLQRNFSATY